MRCHGGVIVPLPEKGGRLCAHPSKRSCLSWCYLWGAQPMPTRAPGTAGTVVVAMATGITATTTAFGHHHRHYSPTLRVWARPPRLSPFLWGDILRRTPGMGCSRALHWRSPGSPRCTSVVLLHGPGGLLSHSVSVHGALDSGSAFRVAVRGLAGAPDVRVLARYVVWARHTFSGPAIQVGSEPPSPVD